MDYKEFNNKVLDYYISRSTSSFCTFSIDQTELEKLIPVSEIKLFQELKSCWSNLLHDRENKPQYFGLIAAQCFAASKMHRDEKNAEDAYKVRLKEVLGLDENCNLQNLFHGEDSTTTVQEEIWYGAKKYVQATLGQHLDIPARTRYAGKFVQYPKSQVLLTLQDLKNFTSFFSEEFAVDEAIPYDYFEERLLCSLSNIRLSQRVRLLFNDDNKKKNCIRQVYDYFNKWEGEIYLYSHSSDRAMHLNVEGLLSKQSKLLLSFEGNDPAFSLINSNFEVLSVVSVTSIFNSENVQHAYTGLMLFNELEYENEFISSRFLYSDSNAYILLNTQLRCVEYRFLVANSSGKIFLTPEICLFQYRVSEKRKFSPLSKYILSRKPVTILGGIKLTRAMDFLVGYGPSIQCSLPYMVIHQNSRCYYDQEKAGAGFYKVRMDNFKDLEFQLVEKKALLEPIRSREMGWNLSTFKMDAIFHVEGCYMAFANKSDIKTWINLNKRIKSKRYTGSNLLLKAIKQTFL